MSKTTKRLRYAVVSSTGQTYKISHPVVLVERAVAVTVLTTEPEKGICEGLFFPDGTARFATHGELVRQADGQLVQTGTVEEDFELPDEVALVVKAIQNGPNKERAKWRKQYPG